MDIQRSFNVRAIEELAEKTAEFNQDLEANVQNQRSVNQSKYSINWSVVKSVLIIIGCVFVIGFLIYMIYKKISKFRTNVNKEPNGPNQSESDDKLKKQLQDDQSEQKSTPSIDFASKIESLKRAKLNLQPLEKVPETTNIAEEESQKLLDDSSEDEQHLSEEEQEDSQKESEDSQDDQYEDDEENGSKTTQSDKDADEDEILID